MSPGTVSKWIQPHTSGKVIAAARMQPHMISQCAAPRSAERAKMKRFAATSVVARRARRHTFDSRKPRARNICHPRRQYIRVGGRSIHIA
jgi:hypothetical protein